MANKELMDKMSIYIPQSKIGRKPVERLMALGKKMDRSVNYLVVEAILQYVDREEKKPG
ncbi:ribbon-helix-helix domain-containing protein [Candidatus Bipolaricaulota bacterium]|nr:ribbon-helix-helix domain-containing protein [Candidatus Bipolaricaulota bacterium]